MRSWGEFMNLLNVRARSALLAVACLLASLLSSVATAAHPTYWTLGRQHPAAGVQPVHPHAYAYGWFGATARPQASRQTGYYGLYRQWNIK